MPITERIYQLPAGSAVTDTSYFPDEDTANANVTEKLTALQIYTYIKSKLASGGETFSWSDVTSSPQALAKSHGYIADLGTLLTFTLPTTVAVGETFIIVGKGSGGWIVTQSASQLIHVGSSVTTTGVGGSVAS